MGRAVAVTPDLAADSVCDLLDLFRVLPKIDDFPALAGSRLEVSGSRRLLAHWLEHSRLEPA